ncbi:MAG TPA: hypothetical protein PK402_13365, partial [Tepidisphaeraceae bacterium]|nr:hypothetical protein [Tepidisphaeraceae bacterium]
MTALTTVRRIVLARLARRSVARVERDRRHCIDADAPLHRLDDWVVVCIPLTCVIDGAGLPRLTTKKRLADDQANSR